jgi:hypothetical protein
MYFALETLLGSVSLVGSHHLDETEATRLLAVRVTHDVAFLDFAILLEQSSDFFFGKAGVNSGHEEVRAGVAGSVFGVSSTRLRRWATVYNVSSTIFIFEMGYSLPAVAAVGRGAASS